MNGTPEQSQLHGSLIIGVHREKLAFALKVVQQLDSNIHVIRIESGLSHERSLYRSGFYHSTAHREMYLQLHQQLKGKMDFVIDLHTGINETGRCADILTADTEVLQNMKKQLDTIVHHTLSPPGEEHLYRITEPDEHKKNRISTFPVCHTIIPKRVWDGGVYVYADLEIYLHGADEGTLVDCEYAAQLIRMLCRSMINTQNTQAD